MTDFITTLHPENDSSVNLYPNIKKENIPSNAIDRNKLDDTVNALLDSINELHPSGTDTSTNILAYTTNKGIYVATDNGHWYYWNGSQYVDGGVYISSIDTTTLSDLESSFNDIFSVSKNILDSNNFTVTTGKYLNVGNGNLSNNDAYLVVNEYIPVKPNTTYYFNSWSKTSGNNYSFSPILCFYDINKGFLSGLQNNTFTTPSNAYYIRISTLISVYNDRLITCSADSILLGYVPYYKLIKNDLVFEKIKLTVGSSSNSDFKKLRKCLDSITDSSINKQYIIELEEGTYDLSTEITAEEIADNTFKGVFVPDYTTIIGKSVDDTIIQLTLASQNQNISVLNFKNTSGIENVTIIGTNTRYVIHDDFADGSVEKYYRIFKNVKLIGNTCYFSSCYGCGAHSGMNAIFENCVFDGNNVLTLGGLGIPFLIHNNVEWDNASYFTFDNCRFLTTKSLPDNVSASRGGLLLRTLKHAYNDTSRIANMFTYITLKGNNVNGIVLREENSTYYGTGCMFKVSGYYNIDDEYRNYNTDGIDYSSYVDLI